MMVALLSTRSVKTLIICLCQWFRLKLLRYKVASQVYMLTMSSRQWSCATLQCGLSFLQKQDATMESDAVSDMNLDAVNAELAVA